MFKTVKIFSPRKKLVEKSQVIYEWKINDIEILLISPLKTCFLQPISEI